MKKLIIYLSFIAILFSACTRNNYKGPERIVKIKTSYGNILVKLYDETPKHRDNFIKLAEDGYFDNLLFHRVIQSFMIQGGDPNSKNAEPGKVLGEGGPNYTIPAELVDTIYHKKGVIAAARENDDINPMKASSGSQFYLVQGKVFSPEELEKFTISRNKNTYITIVRELIAEAEKEAMDKGEFFDAKARVKEFEDKAHEIYAKTDTLVLNEKQKKIYTTVGGTPWLDGNYTVFGEIIKGLEVVDKIAAQEVDKYARPLEDIKMKIKVIK